MKSLNFVWFIFIFFTASSQTNFGKRWVINPWGYNILFDNTIVHDTSFLINEAYYARGHSNICDSSGNLFIACDGLDLFSSNFQLMDNGDSLVPLDIYDKYSGHGNTPQASIILPMENKKYYVITPTVSDAYYQNIWLNKPALNWNFDLLLYHIVDMNANNGLGKVVEKKKTLLQNTPLKKSQMTACRHANGKDWWLMKMAGDTNMVFTFLVKQDTIIRYPNQYIPFPFLGANEIFGQMKFTKDGTKWATTCAWVQDNTYAAAGDVYIADFDRCTGVLSSFQRHVAPPYMSDTSNAGLEFSPNGQFLYVSKYSGIQQLDISAGTWYDVTGPDTNAFCGYTTLELAPDNKIYIGRFHGTCKQMSVINSPDVKFNCDFCPNCLRSKSNWGYFSTPPNMPNYELGASGQPCWPLQSSEVEKLRAEIRLSPNPFDNKLTIEYKLESGEEAIFILYDLVGKEVYRTGIESSTNKATLSIPELTKGFYLYRYSTKKGNVNYSGKLIKE
jgi:hypothetical protein